MMLHPDNAFVTQPCDRVIGLDWYDGVTQGVMQMRDGREYGFAMDYWQNRRMEMLRFGKLWQVPAGTAERICAVPAVSLAGPGLLQMVHTQSGWDSLSQVFGEIPAVSDRFITFNWEGRVLAAWRTDGPLALEDATAQELMNGVEYVAAENDEDAA